MSDKVEIAGRVRRACVEAALAAYDDAGIRGLCGEGRWEYAIDAVRQLDLERILSEHVGGDAAGDATAEPMEALVDPEPLLEDRLRFV